MAENELASPKKNSEATVDGAPSGSTYTTDDDENGKL